MCLWVISNYLSTNERWPPYAVLYAAQHYFGKWQQSVQFETQNSQQKCLLFVVMNDKLQVPSHNTLLLVITTGVAYRSRTLAAERSRAIRKRQHHGEPVSWCIYASSATTWAPTSANPAWSYVRYDANLGSDNSPCIMCCFLLSRTVLPARSKNSAAEEIQDNTDALRL